MMQNDDKVCRRTVFSRRPRCWTAAARRGQWAVLFAVVAVTLWRPCGAEGAELRLRAECRPAGTVVTLGDLAEIRTADGRQADRLASVELFPAPPPGQRRFVRLREIQDLLLLRGCNLMEHQFSGAAQVTVAGPLPVANTAIAPGVARWSAIRANGQVSEAVVQYLREQVVDDEPWAVQVALDDSQAQVIGAATGRIAVRGGAPPWERRQRFEVTVPTSSGPVRFAVDAHVALPPAVVVAARSLPRSSAIGPGDVRLERADQGDPQPDSFRSVEEVIGQETTQAIAQGKVVTRSSVRRPLLVRRGEVVTVYARTSGIRVRAIARAKENGSLGDLIAVESFEDRKPYYARVCGIQEAEVYPRAVRSDQSAGEAPRVAGRAVMGTQQRSW